MSESQETYFRMCWMTLKSESSGKLRRKMDDIEIKLCGLSRFKVVDKKSDEHNTAKYAKIV